ncbi:MAG: glycosyltransferase [Candidatus Rokuibacteriota bacterium]
MSGLRILHVIHDFLPRHRAGSEIYAFELCRAQEAQGLQVHVLCAEYDLSRPHGSLRWRLYEGVGVTELINNWAFASFEETYRSALLKRQLGHVIRALQPDVLHVHNLLNLSFDLPAIARAQGIPSVATLHDYTLVCPSGGQRVHQAEQHICATIDPERCRRCFPQHRLHAQMAFGRLALRRGAGPRRLARLAQSVGKRVPGLLAFATKTLHRAPGSQISAGDIALRLERVKTVFESVDLFAAPSRSLADEYRRLGLPAAKVRVSDYGFVPFAPRCRRVAGARLRIGFVGTLVWHKGAHVLLEAVRGLPAGRFEVRIFGDPDTFPDYVAALRDAARGLPVRFMGPFEHDRAADAYGQIDVLVVPSLWPENSPLVIHEAFMAGVPVVGSRLGGVPDLVTHGANGLLYGAFSSSELTAALRSLVEDPERVHRLASALPAVKPIDQDAREWAAVYREVRDPTASPAGRASLGGPRTAAVVLNYRTAAETVLAIRSVQASRSPVRDLIVVDNGSGDGSVEILRERLPGVLIVETRANLGFSGGSNAGIRVALERGAEGLLLLNSDAILPPETLGRLWATLGADPRLGIVGPILVSRSDPERVRSLGMSFSRRSGRMRHLGFGARLESVPRFGHRLVAGVSGCAMLVKREVLERIGALTEDYFFSFEDLDFCLRARAAGFLTACVGDALALHAGSLSIGARSPRRLYFATRNHLLVAQRAAPLAHPGFAWLRAGFILALNLAYALVSSGVPRVAGISACLRGAWDHARGRYGDGLRA